MYIISVLDVHSTAPLRRNQNVTDVQTHFKDFHFLCFFLNWSFAARYIYPPLATIVSAWEYKKRYTVIQKCMWMALWEGWGGQRNSSKISSLNSQNYTCIYCSLSTEKISQAILNSRNIALWYSGNLEIALVLMTVNMRWVQMLLV